MKGIGALNFNIAVVDDELSDIERLKSFIRNWFVRSEHTSGAIRSYTSGEEILRDFVQGKFHVIFMDIMMHQINGIETARCLRQHDIRVPIVFITASGKYMPDAFSVHSFDYILKPYHEKDVFRVLDEVVRVLNAEDPKVTLKVPNGEYEIPMRMISSVVSNGHNVEVNMTD